MSCSTSASTCLMLRCRAAFSRSCGGAGSGLFTWGQSAQGGPQLGIRRCLPRSARWTLRGSQLA
eukprot:11174635-Lingulodinium_polyedra.AAC.1